MNRFRYSLDFGSGYVIVNPFNNKLEWNKKNDINPVIFRVNVTGSVIFLGDEYDDIIAYKELGNIYIDFKIEQYSNISEAWTDIFEGNADLRDSWDINKKSIKLSRFNNDDYYDSVLSNAKIKYGFNSFGLSTHSISTPSTISTTLDAGKVAGTGLTPAQYINAYDINGWPLVLPAPSGVDPRWAYFLFRSTDAGGHNFETISFDYDVGSFELTEIKIRIGNLNYNKWVTLPTFVGETKSVTSIVSEFAYRFPELIDALVPLANTSLTFTEATAVTYTGQTDGVTKYSWFDYTKYLLTESSDVANIDSKETTITLQYVLDLMANAFDLHWYLDGTALKFKHTSEITTSGTLDLSNETQYLSLLQYNDGGIPDVEKFRTQDYKGSAFDTLFDNPPFGELQIYYRDTNQDLSNQSIKENIIQIDTNVYALMSGSYVPDNKNHCLIEVISDASPRTIYGTGENYNNRFSPISLYGHLNKWRYGLSPKLATRSKVGVISIIETEPRPLIKIRTINYNIDILTDFDTDIGLLTYVGNGRTIMISQKLDSDTLKIDSEIWER